MRVALYKNPVFLLGLLIKAIAIAFWVPQVQSEWFVPFVQHAVTHLSLDPWLSFAQQGKDLAAFPYGPIMLLAHAPFVAVGQMVDALFSSQYFSGLGFRISLLFADLGLLWVLTQLTKIRITALLWFYWLSPIVFFITYWHGQTDIVPVLLVTACLLCFKNGRLFYAGGMLSLSIGAKLSAALVFPFLAVFLWQNPRYAQAIKPFAKGLAAFSLPLLFMLLSPGCWQMIFQNPQMGRLYDLQLSIGGQSILYVVPILYALLLYAAWEIRRMNIELLFAFLGMTFFLIVLLCQAPVGWYLWIVPFLTLYQQQAVRLKHMVIMLFYGLFIYYFLGQASGASWALGGLMHTEHLTQWPLYSLALSCLVATGILLAVNIMASALRHNPFFKLMRKPFGIGIAGDSGVGKDTLSQALAQLFGQERVASLSGDDYHRYERHHGLWQLMTHLNPRANALHAFSENAQALLNGKATRCRHYDHQTGRFHPARQVAASDIVLISGLHALYLEDLTQALQVRIFLSMQESLRQALKIKRDVHDRGHCVEKVLESIQKRQADYAEYVKPQAQKADIRYHLHSTCPEAVARGEYQHLSVTTVVMPSFPYEALCRALVALNGTVVTVERVEDKIELTYSDAQETGSAFESVAQTLYPDYLECLALKPTWCDGVLGFMQLVLYIQLATQRN